MWKEAMQWLLFMLSWGSETEQEEFCYGHICRMFAMRARRLLCYSLESVFTVQVQYSVSTVTFWTWRMIFKGTPWRKPCISEVTRMCVIVQRASRSRNRYKWHTQWICVKAFLAPSYHLFFKQELRIQVNAHTELQSQVRKPGEIRRSRQFKWV